MHKILTVVILCFALPGSIFCKDYHVSPGGMDSNSGTRDKPLATIGKAVSVMLPGDTCFIREGVYRETVELKRSGTAGQPIRITAAEGERVIIDGTEPVTGKWEKHRDGIWKVSFDKEIEQLFVDNKPMVEARWPNMTPLRAWTPSAPRCPERSNSPENYPESRMS